jgi:hypothetical protein
MVEDPRPLRAPDPVHGMDLDIERARQRPEHARPVLVRHQRHPVLAARTHRQNNMQLYKFFLQCIGVIFAVLFS